MQEINIPKITFSVKGNVVKRISVMGTFKEEINEIRKLLAKEYSVSVGDVLLGFE